MNARILLFASVVLGGVGGSLLFGGCVGDFNSPNNENVDAGADASSPDVSVPSDASTLPDALSDAGLPLPAVAPGHLALWLTADRGVTCGAGTITSWADQSGKGVSVTSGAHLGPRCAAGHTVNGVDLPFFDTPTPTSAGFFDGSLDIDLAFLNGTDYTIFVVERRWGDRGPTDSILLITKDECGGFHFGYVYYDGFPELDDEQSAGCGAGTKGRTPDAGMPSPLSVDATRLASADAGLRQVWQNGIEIDGTGLPTNITLSDAGGGSIGGGGTGDTRFLGDMAEVVIFDAALTDPERQQMDAYFKAHWNL